MPRICIVAACFYDDIARELVRGASEYIAAAQATSEVIEVPGAFEVPAAVRMAMDSGRYDGYVALGCVIRGETTHYDYVCGESARALMHLAVKHKAAIGYGILTVETMEQAWVRGAVDHGNKGAAAAQACLRMIAIQTQMKAA
jgi:6,7-dimethyl-8-ribityllumazine synthase